MMKKMKGVAPFDDPRTRFKHQNLMQDFEGLHKETEVKRKKLEMMKQRQSSLMAEVRFLRRRYKHLTESQSSKLSPERESLRPSNLRIRSKSNSKGKNQSKQEGDISSPIPRFNSNQDRKLCKRKEGASSRVLDLSHKQRINILPDLNQTESINNGNGTAVKRTVPIFDLNQISREEEELQADSEQTTTMVDSKNGLCRRDGDELQQHADIKLSNCRDVRNGSSRGGKRKISWRDPVALRV